jgi:hypothetical protein
MVTCSFSCVIGTNFEWVQTCSRHRVALLAPLSCSAFQLSTHLESTKMLSPLIPPGPKEKKESKSVFTCSFALLRMCVSNKLQMGPNSFQAPGHPSSSTSLLSIPTPNALGIHQNVMSDPIRTKRRKGE